MAGIINGTGDFILTEMSTKGRAFDEVLAEAQFWAMPNRPARY